MRKHIHISGPIRRRLKRRQSASRITLLLPRPSITTNWLGGRHCVPENPGIFGFNNSGWVGVLLREGV